MGKQVSIGAELTALPLGQMLSGPLTAAIEAQALSAITSVDFINAVGLQGEDGSREAVMIDFSFKNHVSNTETGEVIEKDTSLSIPLLAVVETPFIAVEDLSVSFEFNIRDTMSKANQFNLGVESGVEYTNTTELEGTYGGGLAKFLGGPSGSVKNTSTLKANLNVSAAYQRSSRHDTDRRATLKMTMSARQRTPEGFERVLNILNDAISAQAEVPESSTP